MKRASTKQAAFDFLVPDLGNLSKKLDLRAVCEALLLVANEGYEVVIDERYTLRPLVRDSHGWRNPPKIFMSYDMSLITLAQLDAMGLLVEPDVSIDWRPTESMPEDWSAA